MDRAISGGKLAVYSFAHFWVDFSCALIIFSRLADLEAAPLLALAYNFCAFALQMPIGLIADRISRNSCVAALGCGLVAAAWLLPASPWACVAVAGIGNGCFHVGGGVDVLNGCGRKARALGIFVCPGAMGIYLGTIMGTAGAVPPWASAAWLLAFGALFPIMDMLDGGLDSRNAPLDLDVDGDRLAALACCFAAVVVRSYIGVSADFPWKAGAWSAIATCGVVAGKACGGFVADRLGTRRGVAITMGLSAVLFLMGGNRWAGAAAIFLFNMSMPATLQGAATMLPGAKGFSFGLLTVALFLGYVPACLGLPGLPGGMPAYAALAAACLGALLWGLKKGGIR